MGYKVEPDQQPLVHAPVFGCANHVRPNTGARGMRKTRCAREGRADPLGELVKHKTKSSRRKLMRCRGMSLLQSVK